MSVYICFYNSPLGRMFLTCDSDGITSVGFENQRFSYSDTGAEYEESDTPSLIEGRRWLDIYFSGNEAGFTPPLHLIGTEFQKEVWQILLKIPYGSVMTYGEIAKEIAEKRGLDKMSDHYCHSLVLDPFDNQSLLRASGDVRDFHFVGRIHRSTDGGKSWYLVKDGLDYYST